MPVKDENAMEGVKKISKFIWRHFFTSVILYSAVNGSFFAPSVWKINLLTLIIAIAVDWAKQFVKLSKAVPYPMKDHSPDEQPIPFWISPTPITNAHSMFTHPPEDSSSPLHIRQWWNSSILGTPTNLMNNDYNRY